MGKQFVIEEKPDWISWEDIKKCLVEAHAENRTKGIDMAHYQWPAEKIKEFIGDRGIVLVALDGNKLIGTAALAIKSNKTWYADEGYAYVCFDAIIPQYSGKGVFKSMDLKREEIALRLGFHTLVFDTHEKNQYRQHIALKNGYHFVKYFRASTKDHYNVVMAKWLGKCPYSRFYCFWKFEVSKIKTLLITKFLHR